MKEPLDVNIHILVPSNDIWASAFGHSLAMMMNYLGQVRLAGNVREQKSALVNVRSSLLCQSRDNLLRGSLERGATHVLWLDSDMVFPMTALHDLWRHQKEVVGVNYARKCIPSVPTACTLGNKHLYSDPDSPDLEECGHLGFGVVLMDLKVMQDIPQPWFNMPWSEELGAYSGEDVFFFRKLREKGVKLYVDNKLSKRIKHVGSFEYSHLLMGEVVREEIPSEEI